VICERHGDSLLARPHEALAGRVEIRGQGILSAADLGLTLRTDTVLHLVTDLVTDVPRLPEPPDAAEILGLRLPRLVLDRGVRRAGLATLLIRAALRKGKP
jgi:HPr kinase/phosphorylase